MKCPRCDWQHDLEAAEAPREQMRAHVEATGHPTCGVCQRPLPVEDVATCESCLTRTRALLAGVVHMYFGDLAEELGQLHAVAYDDSPRGAADGRPLPGGDALALLAGGSQGLSEDALTTKDGDPSSVAFDLGYWEQTWRAFFDEPRTEASHRPKVIVRHAAGYLERRAREAARRHPGFPDFADDLRILHDRLEAATGRLERVVRAEAECFGCGADALVRELTDQGYEDRWTCRRCGETYDWGRYLLALSGRLQKSDVPGWGLPEQVAFVLGVNPKTVRSWADRGLVTSACVLGDKRLRVWWDDAQVRADRIEEQRRQAEQRDARKDQAS